MLPWLSWLAIPSVSVVAALLATGPRAQRALALAVALAVVPLPLCMPEGAYALRAVAGLAALTGSMKVWDLVRARHAVSARARALHPLMLADMRRVERVEREWRVRALAAAASYAGLVCLGLALLFLARGQPAPAVWALRWVGGVLALYGAMDVVSHVFAAAHAALGWRTGHLQNRPVLARAVGELWGRRWNGPVSRWVAEHCFWPLARRRMPRLGLAAAFAATALLHFVPVAFALGLVQGLWMAAYFVMQGALVLAERPLGVARWPVAAQRVWTACALLLPAPLVVEPVVTALGFAPTVPAPWLS